MIIGVEHREDVEDRGVVEGVARLEDSNPLCSTSSSNRDTTRNLANVVRLDLQFGSRIYTGRRCKLLYQENSRSIPFVNNLHCQKKHSSYISLQKPFWCRTSRVGASRFFMQCILYDMALPHERHWSAGYSIPFWRLRSCVTSTTIRLRFSSCSSPSVSSSVISL